jgi:EAL domain-containing protein (putative c-di-GMP-specific phosphodiesterase class I)/CheY-like chemotaxis protein
MPDVIFGNRLLLIDDEPAFGRLVKTVAQDFGFEVVITDDPGSFAKTARSWNPTVIVLDLKMPGTDGIQLLRSLAADQCTAQIVISSGSDQKVLEAAMQLGRERGLNMDGVLQKPIRIDAMREMLARLTRLPNELLSTGLPDAIRSNHLFLEYQPKFDCDLRRFTGVEALIRWRHPCHGVILPDEFITLAEKTDVIHQLTDWVVAAGAKQVAIWRDENLILDVAVNISAKDVEDLDLPERLERHCADAGIDPASMTLELTETGAMRQAVQMMDVLTRLRLKGFKLSIDDFGTGYSSLVQLQRLPFTEVKIDRSFVMNMTRNQGCRVIAEIIVELGRRLGLRTVAEGVEDGVTLDALIEMGCQTAQGYYLCRPIPAADLLPFLRETHIASTIRDQHHGALPDRLLLGTAEVL